MHTIGQPPLAIVMGVCGAGKTVVGQALAARLTVPFIDGDDLHPQANIDKMTAGHSLDDSDRQPWLRRIGEWFREHHHTGGVVACSALKRSYRDLLRDECPEVVFIHLRGDQAIVNQRVAERKGHFMPASLLQSQIDTLEELAPDEDGVVLDLSADPQQLIDEAVADVAPGR